VYCTLDGNADTICLVHVRLRDIERGDFRGWFARVIAHRKSAQAKLNGKRLSPRRAANWKRRRSSFDRLDAAARALQRDGLVARKVASSAEVLLSFYKFKPRDAARWHPCC